MQTFTPPRIPDDAPPWFKGYAADLHRRIKSAAVAGNQFAASEALHAEPAKYFPGMEVYADGVDWNPGSGEGKYRRNLANTVWVFIG